MRPKNYDTEKIAEIEKKLSRTTAKPPRKMAHEEAIKRLKPHILTLINEKNFDIREVAKLLKEEGIRTSIRELKELLKEEQ